MNATPRPLDPGQVFMNLLVLQGSPFCNIDCDYCYLPNRGVTRRMPLDVLERTMGRLCDAGLIGPPFSVLWHAGEPLAVPVSYYRRAIEVIDGFPAARDARGFIFQTNAMLINQEWCDFFREFDVQVGVSIDGPEFIHDEHRKTRSGLGTHEQVMAGIQKLRHNNISFGLITVVTETSLDYPDEIFSFLLSLGSTGVGFNVEEIEGANATSSLSANGAEIRVRAFLRRIYELNREHGFALAIREFDDARERILGAGGYVNTEPAPFSMVNVDCDGNFSTFSPELLGQETIKYGSFAFGNMLEHGIRDARRNASFQQVAADISAGNKQCAESCYYFPFCGGASPSNKYYENKTFDSTETMHCRCVIQAPVDIVREDLYRHGQWPQAAHSAASAEPVERLPGLNDSARGPA